VVLVRPASSPPYSSDSLEALLQRLSPNPPFGGNFSFLAGSLSGLFFCWQGGTSAVDFVVLAPAAGSITVFDAKVSHQTYLKSGPHVSHTVDSESLVPQSSFLSSVTGSNAAIAFWSPFIGPRWVPQAAADRSVTINCSSPLLEESLLQVLEKSLGDTLNSSDPSEKSEES